MTIPTICKTVKLYSDENGKVSIEQWLQKLDKTFRRVIDSRLARLLLGNYGDFKRINKDIFELRFQIGSGYRIYFAEESDTIVLLLCGGDKKTQKHDIEKAIEYYERYRRIKNDQNI